MRRGIAALLAVLATAALAGCEPAAPVACTEAGARCALPDGPLGVCERTPCPTGEAGPCFTCVPQH